MVKFTATGDDGIVRIGLGLEAENIRRMQAGQPVRVRLSDLGFIGQIGAIQILIFAGEDAASMQRDLAPFIGPETVIHDERPTR